MFKERLKELRESRNLTQSQLSEVLGIGRASVSNYELGTRTPDIDVLLKIADYFEVTTDYLTGKSQFKNFKDELYYVAASDKFGLSPGPELNKEIVNTIEPLYQAIYHYLNVYKLLIATNNNAESTVNEYLSKVVGEKIKMDDYLINIIKNLTEFINSLNNLCKYKGYEYCFDRDLMGKKITEKSSNDDLQIDSYYIQNLLNQMSHINNYGEKFTSEILGLELYYKCNLQSNMSEYIKFYSQLNNINDKIEEPKDH